MKTERMKEKTGNYFKGQAMMEYLMTYGLALIVILVVLGILATVVLQNLQPPETCQFTQAGLSCSNKKHSLVSGPPANAVNLIFQLDNQEGRSIDISAVLCSNAPTGNIQKTSLQTAQARLSRNVTLAPGASAVFGSSTGVTTGVTYGGAATLNCYNLDTATPSQLVLAPNSNFKGSVAILYRFQDDLVGAPDKVAVANLGGVIEAR
ncbi:hypothetical protein HY990_04740 [Candidatus Micrarchaeota archaeon]|nr:hypothetical protein [Candidatus Micrarchaeota archaeon]